MKTMVALLAGLFLIASAQPAGTSKPVALSAEEIAKLIEELDAPDFAARQRATTALGKLGRTSLPILRQAAVGKSLEARLRLDRVIAQISSRDRPRHGLSTLLDLVFKVNPQLDERALAGSLHALTLGRAATAAEADAAIKRLKNAKNRAEAAHALLEELMATPDFKPGLAEVNLWVGDIRRQIAAADLAGALQRINSEELMRDLRSNAAKLLASGPGLDGRDLADAVAMLVVCRTLKDQEWDNAKTHLQRVGKKVWTEDVFWALMNTKEFLRVGGIEGK